MTTNPAWAAQSDTLEHLAAALVEAQTQMTDVAKGRTANAGTYGYAYADLSDVLATVRPVLAAHGLTIMQTAEVTEHDAVVYTTLMHRSGQYLTAQPVRLPAGKTAQNTGSALTYARRYSVMALLGIAAGDDDDGASASPRDERQTRTQAPQRARQPQTIEPKTEPKADHYRSEDERWIRTYLATLDPVVGRAIRDGFLAEFGCNLSALPVEGHQAARAWVEEFVEPEVAQ